MLEEKYLEKITQSLPFDLNEFPELNREFREKAYYAKIPLNKDIFVEGDDVNDIALLISGVVRVYKVSPTGREITLYRFGEGESCIIAANAILHDQNFPAIAIVEREAEAVMIPTKTFTGWVKRYDPWRDFVFKLFSARLAMVMEIIDEVVFHRMDFRLASFLFDRGNLRNPIFITHQEIANEIGSSREVISRILEDFAAREIVRLSRGEVEILNFEKLKELTSL
jgi:CRP/FNR family transcriptional regulator, anaerobic regulatory protein